MDDDGFRRGFSDALAAACRQAGVPASGAVLLHLHSNAVYTLPAVGLAARVSSSPEALARIAASLRVTAQLAAGGFPCTEPAPLPRQPYIVGGKIITFWRFVPLAGDQAPYAADLGRLLRDLHARPLPPAPRAWSTATRTRATSSAPATAPSCSATGTTPRQAPPSGTPPRSSTPAAASATPPTPQASRPPTAATPAAGPPWRP